MASLIFIVLQVHTPEAVSDLITIWIPGLNDMDHDITWGILAHLERKNKYATLNEGWEKDAQKQDIKNPFGI